LRNRKDSASAQRERGLTDRETPFTPTHEEHPAMSTTRTLAAALAIAALAVPAAQAQPADNAPNANVSAKAQITQDPIADIHAPLARVAAANARAQDLHHLRAGAHSVNAPGATAVDSATRPSAPGATYTSGATAGGQYTPGATAGNSQPLSITWARAVNHPASGGVNPTIGLGIASSLLAIAGVVGLARRGRRSRRMQRARVNA
jgi:hypothetical protein